MTIVPVSVVIPTFNIASMVCEAVDSCLAQLPQLHEVVVVDDGSRDETPQVLEQYITNPRVKLLRTENRGLGPARNLGWGSASGEYVQFLDGDDRLSADYSQVIGAQLARPVGRTNQPPDLVVFGASRFGDVDEWGHSVPNYERSLEADFESGAEAVLALAKANCLFPNATLLIVRRERWLKAELAFKPIYHEDEEIFLRLYASSRTVRSVNAPLYERRLRPGSIMTSQRGPRTAEGYREIARTYLAQFAETPPEMELLKPLIRRRLFQYTVSYTELAADLGMPIDRKLVSLALFQLRSVEATSRCVKAMMGRGRS